MNDLLFDMVRLVAGAADVRCRAWLRLMDRFRQRGSRRLARLCSNRLKRYGVYVSPTARIPRSTIFPHPTAIVIGAGVEIGENVRIFQSVTLGGARIGDFQAGRYPRVGRGTTIFAGAVIVGDLHIGENCTIGANSVVLSDVPDNATCVGAPARMIDRKPTERVSR